MVLLRLRGVRLRRNRLPLRRRLRFARLALRPQLRFGIIPLSLSQLEFTHVMLRVQRRMMRAVVARVGARSDA